MRVIAITGGIGAGKSTVRKMFEELGAFGIDADELARQVVAPGTEGNRQIREAFGPEFFDGEGHLDRKRMARRVFKDAAARRGLESILHPLIRSEEERLLEDFSRRAPGGLAVVEIPLLAEGGRSLKYEGVVLVSAPEDVRISRLVRSGRYDHDDASARMASQALDRDREDLANWKVDNGESLEETWSQVRRIYGSLAS